MSDNAKCSRNPTSSPPSSARPVCELLPNHKPDENTGGLDKNPIRSPSPLCATELINALSYLRSIRPSSISFKRSRSSSSLIGLPPPRPAPTVEVETTRRILEWRQDLEDDDDMYVHVVWPSEPTRKHVSESAWISFLPSLRSRSSSRGSSVYSVSSGEGEVRPSVEVRFEHGTVSEESIEVPPTREDHEEIKSWSQVSEDTRCSDELDTWPYDGRGLYEHHPKHECGLACFAACQRRRKFRPRMGSKPRVLDSLARLLKRVGADGPEQMMNSDVPHPPWWLEYRSNDDTLREDEDDGDVELWLEHTTQRQQMDHELRFRLLLNQKPDSRIFWF